MVGYGTETLWDLWDWSVALRWRHNGRNSVSNHQPHDCLLNRLFRRRSKKTSKLRVTGLCAGNSPGTGEFPAQMASNAENATIGWRHHGEYACAWFYIFSLSPSWFCFSTTSWISRRLSTTVCWPMPVVLVEGLVTSTHLYWGERSTSASPWPSCPPWPH